MGDIYDIWALSQDLHSDSLYSLFTRTTNPSSSILLNFRADGIYKSLFFDLQSFITLS